MGAKVFWDDLATRTQAGQYWTEEPAAGGETAGILAARRRCWRDRCGLFNIPAGPHEDTAALQVLANILSTQPQAGFTRHWSNPKSRKRLRVWPRRTLTPV